MLFESIFFSHEEEVGDVEANNEDRLGERDVNNEGGTSLVSRWAITTGIGKGLDNWNGDGGEGNCKDFEEAMLE